MYRFFSHRTFKFLAVFLAVNITGQIFLPLTSYALTSGPSQPEVQSFEPVGTTEMVDLFTGDFTYNIPLFELPGPNGGYPFNLHYNSGISMDQEASWVGLGWNLNPGVINRQMRGFPDDFKADQIKREQDIRDNVTVGGGFGGAVEVFGSDAIQASLGIGVYYNNYKGVGYTLDAGLRFSGGSEGINAGLGLNLSMDSQEGVGVNPSISLGNTSSDYTTSYTLGANYNSRRGLTSVSMGFNSSKKVGPTKEQYRKGERKSKTYSSYSGSSTISYAGDSYSPQVSMPMRGRNISLTYKVGGELFGAFPNGYLKGFFSTQYLKDKTSYANAYGYMYLENAGTGDLMDFNREKDGMIRKNTPNLPAPVMTNDIYSVSGQGIGGMYRAYRSDVGVLSDQRMTSNTFGGGAGYETGVGTGVHFGADLSVNYSNTTSGKWEDQNQAKDLYNFSGSQSGNKLYEPYYFKTYGEHTTDTINELAYIGWKDPVSIELERNGSSVDVKYTATKNLRSKKGVLYPEDSLSNFNPLEKREPRNLVVQPISNSDLLDNNNKEILKEFKIRHFTATSSLAYRGSTDTATYNRASKRGNHTAGITALNPDGTRYVYGLPAYNKTQVECQFSVQSPADLCSQTIKIEKSGLNPDKPNYKDHNETDKYYNRTTVPEYAHSYLLTSILGADYVDADSIEGPSVGDLGYWVKFNYVKVTDNYKWRVPFNDANYMKGFANNTIIGDDKGAYTYGEKEVWYLATVETKSHVASFNTSERKDAFGAQRELQNSADPTDFAASNFGEASYKLDSISLYSRTAYESAATNPVAISTVHFQYTYDLCGYVPNNNGESIDIDGGVSGTNVNLNQGKLTLKKLWFTHENNKRGSLSPYEFDYHESNPSENPDYHTHKYDRWGNYKPYVDNSANRCASLDFPYVNQFDLSNPDFKAELDTNMAVWNLKSIKLPSGGEIDIQYEADDYAYVQNKTAMQMFKIESLSKASVGTDNTIDHPTGSNTGADRRVYFNLEHPIAKSLPAQERKAEVKKYIDPNNKLFFKVCINLLKPNQDNIQDFISGYVNIADYDVDTTSVNGENECLRAYVEMEKMRIGSKVPDYHPFSVAAWQHLRTNQPDLANLAGYKGDPNANASRKEQMLRSLVSAAGEIKKIFQGFYKYCYNKDYGKEINLDRSYIRLNSPDKIKYGGGCRVKEVVIKDNWTNITGEAGSVYGQVYDYSMEEKGVTISSGVAAYEPMIGGEEIALRSAKGFSEEIPMQTPNNLYFETPINESYYPGASVGYRKVTLKSLATHYEQIAGGEDPYNIPSGVSTTGATVHEFYTSKEFPVINDETTINAKPFDLFIPIPLLGQVTVNNLTASQGYVIELNDMHGKLKKVSNYGQDPSGNIIPEPISWIKYNYQADTVFSSSGDRSEDYLILNNTVSTLITDKDGVAVKDSTRMIGQDYEFFTDMRECKTFSAMGGANINTDFFIVGIFPIPAFMIWPNFGTSTKILRTAVVNKVIHRSGILMSTEAYDGGSLVRTDNKLFDALTGQPVLTTVTNDFDNPIYNYNLPAHMVYDGIGPAYKNIGLRFTASLTSGSETNYYNVDTTNLPWKELVPGDEFVITDRIGTFTKLDGSNLEFYIEGTSYTGSKDFVLVRSGRRNHLDVNAGSISALSDPTENRTNDSCSTTFKIPKVTQVQYEVTTPGECSYNMINLIDGYVRSGSYAGDVTITSAPWSNYGYICGNNESVIFTHMNSPSTGRICFSSSSSCSGISIISSYFYEEGGSLLNFSNVDTLKNLTYTTTYPIAISTSETFRQMSVDVKYDNGSTGKAYIFGSVWWATDLQYLYRDSMYLADTTIAFDRYKINNILNASASTFSDNWPLDNSVLRGDYWSVTNRSNFDAKDPYAKGSDGIWRIGETYTYVDNRKQSSGVNTEEDGTFDDFNLFNFINPEMADCGPTKWRKVNTVTDYNPFSLETENKDIQGIYSSALYGYKGGDLVTAIASNARNSEIAFESFEEFTPGGTIDMKNYGTGNLHVFTSAPTGTINTYNTYKIISGNKNLLAIDKPFYSDIQTLTAEVDGTIYYPTSLAGTKIKGTYDVTLEQEDAGNTSQTLIQLDASQFGYGEVKWTGSAKLKFKVSDYTPVSSYSYSTSVSSTYAHTGKNSLYVYGNVTFEQRKLNLIPGKKYVFSSWGTTGVTSVSTYGGGYCYSGVYAAIYFMDVNRNQISYTTIYPQGSIVNFWQKIEGEFTVPVNTVSIKVQLIGGGSCGGAQSGYFDDIRIHPSTSNMQTYVYDNTDYKLKAVLDNNNYATLYYYDAAGNLHLVKKETERGIQAIKESVGHIAE